MEIIIIKEYIGTEYRIMIENKKIEIEKLERGEYLEIVYKYI